LVLNLKRQCFTRARIGQWYSAWATGWMIGASSPGKSWEFFTTASIPALGLTQPPTQWIPGALSLVVKRPGREANHSHPSSAEVKNVWSYTSTPPIRLHCVVLNLKNTGTPFFTFYFYLCPCFTGRNKLLEAATGASSFSGI
jgi:hypothetical protein